MEVLKLITTIVLICILSASAKEVIETIKVITENLAHYRTDITWTIEHFEDLPFVAPPATTYYNPSITSPAFPANSKAGVQWRLIAYPSNDRHGSADFNLVVGSEKKPSNSTLEARVTCGIVDRNGKLLSKQSEEINLNIYLFQLATREEIKLKAADVLPEGHLTLKCNIVGTLTIGDKSHVTSEELTNKKIPISQCANEIALDTLDRLSRYNYALRKDGVMIASGTRLQIHKDILSNRSPLLKTALDKATYLDFGNLLTSQELKDFVTFLYTGTAENLAESCKNLYPFVKRYYPQDCLLSTCEDVFIGQVREETAYELLRFSLERGITNLTKAAATCLKQGSNCNKA